MAVTLILMQIEYALVALQMSAMPLTIISSNFTEYIDF